MPRKDRPGKHATRNKFKGGRKKRKTKASVDNSEDHATTRDEIANESVFTPSTSNEPSTPKHGASKRKLEYFIPCESSSDEDDIPKSEKKQKKEENSEQNAVNVDDTARHTGSMIVDINCLQTLLTQCRDFNCIHCSGVSNNYLFFT